jgi:putative toxin-antitoxin system antitoxin component (TIGR02293 family)
MVHSTDLELSPGSESLSPSSKRQSGALASKTAEALTNFVADFTKLLATDIAPRVDVATLRKLEPSFTREEIETIVVAKRTLARRIAKKERLTVGETDRALRLARIGAQAESVFGDHEKAARWLRKPSRALSGQTPIVMLRTETGAQLVNELLGQIAHGLFI